MLPSMLLYAGAVDTGMPLTGHGMAVNRATGDVYLFGGIPSISPTVVEATAAVGSPMLTMNLHDLIRRTESFACGAATATGGALRGSHSTSAFRGDELIQEPHCQSAFPVQKSDCWSEIPSSNNPCSRHGHWMHYADGEVFVMGGRFWPINDTPAHDHLVFQPRRRVWRRLVNLLLPTRFAAAVASAESALVCDPAAEIVPSSSSSSISKVKSFPIGNAFLEVTSHTVFQFGGLSETRELTNTFFAVDLKKGVVTQIWGAGTHPEPQFKGSMTYYDDQLFLMEGLRSDAEEKKTKPSVYVYSLAGNMWRKVATAAGTVRSQLVPLGVTRLNQVALFGGMPRHKNTKRSREIYIFDLEEMCWVGRKDKEGGGNGTRLESPHPEGKVDNAETDKASSCSSLTFFPGLTSHIMVSCPLDKASLEKVMPTPMQGGTTTGASKEGAFVVELEPMGFEPAEGETDRKESIRSAAVERASSIFVLLCFAGSEDSVEYHHADGEPVGVPTPLLHLFFVLAPTLKELAAREIHAKGWSNFARERLSVVDETVDSLF
jgi:hypothetical protein